MPAPLGCSATGAPVLVCFFSTASEIEFGSGSGFSIRRRAA